jgi:hypothetical protein
MESKEGLIPFLHSFLGYVGTREQVGITGKLIKMPMQKMVLHAPTNEVYKYEFINGKAIFSYQYTIFKLRTFQELSKL